MENRLQFVNPYAIIVVLIVFIGQMKCSYPDGADNPRPCVQLKYTVRYSGQICVPTSGGKWNTDSEYRCKNVFRKECPEFNEGECAWQEITICNKTISFPACKLRYYAASVFSVYTWMEIYYVNQYGTSSEDNSIIEIHRFIKRHETFREKDQKDFPDNVPDKNQGQGLAWHLIYSNNKQKPSKRSEQICPNLADDGKCTRTIKELMISHYENQGIGPYKGKNYILDVRCGYYFISNYIRESCRLKFSMNIKLNNGENFTQQIAEAIVYNDDDLKAREWIYIETVYGGNSILPDGKLIR